ncbi:MAG: EamA family transporter [Zoogloeaceae bacterium]|jgi:multidrug transporter EmrE-like cation transporter|nr:EamA family transporter [Zoogloeaceae bacterium]
MNAARLMIGVGTWGMLICGVLLNATAQLMLKAGTTKIGVLWTGNHSLLHALFRIAFQPFILGGLACYVASVALWIIVLSRVPVSVAYPMLSIGYIVNALAAHFLFAETLHFSQIAGIGVIIIGIFLMTR